MTSHYPSEPETSAPEALSSTPSSDHPPPPPARWHHDDTGATRVRLMCSFGGRILPRPGDHQLRYVGGDTRIVAVPRSATFASLLGKLSRFPGCPTDVTVKYQLPSEDLDALISVTSDEDVDNMMEEYDRLAAAADTSSSSSKTPRLRLFLFPPSSSGFGSTLDSPASSSSKRDSWFFDALNGGRGGPLERGRSEASSIVSEVPDYLFGLDNNSDEPKPIKAHAMSMSDPGSPAPAESSSQFCSAPAVPPIPDLPPVKIKLEAAPKEARDVDMDVPGEVHTYAHAQPGYVPNPIWQYVHEPLPVYYVPGPVPGGSLPVQPVPVQYVHQVPPVPGTQLPVGYAQPVHGLVPPGPVYVARPAPGAVAAAESYELAAGGGLVRNPSVIPAYPMAGVPLPAGEPPSATGPEMRIGRASP